MFNIEKVFDWIHIRCQVLHQAVLDCLEEDEALNDLCDHDVDDVEDNSEKIHFMVLRWWEEDGIKSLSFEVFALEQFTEEWNL